MQMFVRRDTERRLRVGADSRGGNRRSWLARTPLQSERLPAIRGRFIQREPRALRPLEEMDFFERKRESSRRCPSVK